MKKKDLEFKVRILEIYQNYLNEKIIKTKEQLDYFVEKERNTLIEQIKESQEKINDLKYGKHIKTTDDFFYIKYNDISLLKLSNELQTLKHQIVDFEKVKENFKKEEGKDENK